MKRKLSTAIIILALVLGSAPALVMAQDDQSEPSTGVARVSLINGNVSTQRGDSGDWVGTTMNAPLVPGDRISTGQRSRTEVQLDYANVLRLDQNSEAKVADLTRSRIQVQLAQGLLDFSTFKGSQADVEIDTPNVAVQPTGPGTFRIQVSNQGETQVIVRDGQAQISTPQGSTTVKEGDLITVEGTDTPEYQVSNAPGRDAWDDWNQDRDNIILNAQSYSHTNRYYTGAQDLDRSGHWVHVPGYDWCWTPYVNAGWVPYRDGRWVWEPGWGWTWVSYEPWGWAPYHYGRWFYYGDSWCWWPGYAGYGYYPVWAPAYVSFIGFGFGYHHFGFGFGYGFGSIGWLPLGPLDYCRPWWGHRGSYNVVNVTNITNITNVTNINNASWGSNFHGALTNSRIRGALTTVSANDFAGGRVLGRVQSVNVNQLRQGNVIQGTLPVVPTRQSLSPTNRPATVPMVAHTGAGQRAFFTRNQPSAVPQSFEQHAGRIQQMINQRNTLQPAKTDTAAQSGFRNEVTRPMAGASGAASVNARTRPEVSAGTQTNARPGSAETNSGWRTFGRTPQSAAPAPANVPRTSSESGKVMAGQSGPQRLAPAAQESAQASRPGFTRFGSAAAPGAAVQSQPAGSRAPQQSTPAARPQPAPAPNRGQPASSGWRRFGSDNPRSAPSSGQAAPRTSQPATREAPQSAPRSQPAVRNDSPPRGNNWRQFDSRPAPGSASRAEPAPRSERSYSPSRAESPAYRAAPRGYERPPLEIRKPIVVERSPGSYGSPSRGSWGSPSRGSWGAPSGGGGGSQVHRGGSGGGGGRPSAPSPSTRSGGGGGNHRH